MDEVENAVGEADAQALAAPLVEMLVHHLAVARDLFVVGAHRARHQHRAHLGEVDGGGAALADHDRGGGVGGAGRGFKVRAERQHRGDGRDHGVAGAGNVAYFHGVRGNVNRIALGSDERHAFFAAG